MIRATVDVVSGPFQSSQASWSVSISRRGASVAATFQKNLKTARRICCCSGGSYAGRLFGPSKDKEWWDEKCVFHPIVIKDLANNNRWRMYYYGRDSEVWSSSSCTFPALMSTGHIGLACSPDGVWWSKVQGPLPKGAILDARPGGGFDGLHVGCSDVLWHDGMWWMFYFGGGLEVCALPNGRNVTGLKLRTGLCKSASVDGITGFDEMREVQPVLDVGAPNEWDATMAAWARVVPPSQARCHHQYWLMTYSALDVTLSTPSFAIGVAISQDGSKWTKIGKVLERGEPGSWDESGVGRRHVLFVNGEYVMFYEGVNSSGLHAIGLALSKDGITWVKDKHGGNGQPGGPIFHANADEQDSWDSGGVAAPHVTVVGNSFWLYYVGFDKTKQHSAFGLACSQGQDYRIFERIKNAHQTNHGS